MYALTTVTFTIYQAFVYHGYPVQISDIVEILLGVLLDLCSIWHDWQGAFGDGNFRPL